MTTPELPADFPVVQVATVMVEGGHIVVLEIDGVAVPMIGCLDVNLGMRRPAPDRSGSGYVADLTIRARVDDVRVLNAMDRPSPFEYVSSAVKAGLLEVAGDRGLERVISDAMGAAAIDRLAARLAQRVCAQFGWPTP